MLVLSAFNVQNYQIVSGRNEIDSPWFEINAVPPDDSPSRNIKAAYVLPTPDQEIMLQALLRDRFGFKYHFETKEGELYILTRGRKPPRPSPPKDPNAEPRATIVMKGRLAGSEAEGINTTADYLAQRLSRYLQLPVQYETGLIGSFDFHLDPDDPENHDLVAAVHSVVDRLRLKLKRERGPIKTLVIDHIDIPSEN